MTETRLYYISYSYVVITYQLARNYKAFLLDEILSKYRCSVKDVKITRATVQRNVECFSAFSNGKIIPLNSITVMDVITWRKRD